ncbi:MAG: glycosyltransferase family 2 protein [Actinobacteria bacterium]|nr:glycosyltransferase family 2 protein [Actinomycetota bacterium]MCB9427399.1 glycosyltransferase family 2 protein [Actinomycetota bacterium]MCO5298476.1 glycosyltransferase family 2 protein [Candidatus Nanopelagicales bacterium]HPE12334.1 glycosyltransferase family 2 protein [Actinomycetota bacterium]HRV66235.1 glycosyltransferase family 2 protein [Candidatus Nanopelagicales bacterium]
MDQYPPVAVIMPVLNEERHLAEAVAAIAAQDYPGELQIALALGPSTDRTDEVASVLHTEDPRVRLVPNPTGKTPAGLNAALAATDAPIVVRVDGHALLPPDYVRAAVAVLERTDADNVGGVMAAEGSTDFERAVACAMRSRLGVGSASFHTGGQEGPALTVYLGAFKRSALERVGGYDEAYVRAQDWEMNHRIRQTGGLVWFTPAMQVTYRPRSTVKALAKQYLHYGRWRREIMRQHRETVSLRYLAAPVAVAVITSGLAGATAARIAGSRWAWLGLVPAAAYVAGTGVGGAAISTHESARVRRRVPIALATMHMSWGVGFLTSPKDLRP